MLLKCAALIVKTAGQLPGRHCTALGALCSLPCRACAERVYLAREGCY